MGYYTSPDCFVVFPVPKPAYEVIDVFVDVGDDFFEFVFSIFLKVGFVTVFQRAFFNRPFSALTGKECLPKPVEMVVKPPLADGTANHNVPPPVSCFVHGHTVPKFFNAGTAEDDSEIVPEQKFAVVG